MKKLFILIFACMLVANTFAQTKNTFTLGENTFLLDGKPYLIRAGEIHFPRIPREYWEQRIKMCKAMGMNTICIYLFWNYHEQQPDIFDFTGQKDVAEFVKLIQKNGMYAIVRPGPYSCAEWDMGGLPWWLLKKKDLKVRTRHDAYFMERSSKYLLEVGKQLAPLQIQNGGNIIMVQVENEYAVFGNDSIYMSQVRDIIRSKFDKVQLFRCDWSSTFYAYNVDNVATTLNFGAGSNIDDQFKKFKEVYPKAPLMCSEYWTGWFDYWGRNHETRSIETFLGSLKDMMNQNISFSFYMAHGGTTFGQWGGANCPPYGSMVASYDYDAPISEGGLPNQKFWAVRDLLKNHLNEGEVIPDVPAPFPVMSIPEINFTQVANVFDNLPKAKTSELIQPMEMFDQGWGRIVYRTKLPAIAAGSKLVITEVHDWAAIFINGKYIGKLDRRNTESELKLNALAAGSQLDILVENMGRVNYGETILDRKGITESVEIVNSTNSISLKNWEVFNLSADYPMEANIEYKTQKPSGPAWYKSSFKLDKVGDTYLDMSTWGKGMVWVNGYNLGRFWSIGPQQTMYMPGCWLKKGKNSIVVLDLEMPKAAKIVGLTKPILDSIVPNESMYHRKKGESLNLNGEIPLVSGTFTPEAAWKEIKMPQTTKARYICFEALNAQNADDNNTSVAEIELVDEAGNLLSRVNWKVVYADSEEVLKADLSANKVFDKQESTYWLTAYDATKAKHPHHIVIDLGRSETFTSFKYLPRTDKKQLGIVKDYRFYAKKSPFEY